MWCQGLPGFGYLPAVGFCLFGLLCIDACAGGFLFVFHRLQYLLGVLVADAALLLVLLLVLLLLWLLLVLVVLVFVFIFVFIFVLLLVLFVLLLFVILVFILILVLVLVLLLLELLLGQAEILASLVVVRIAAQGVFIMFNGRLVLLGIVSEIAEIVCCQFGQMGVAGRCAQR